jgi:hypothetical protein
VLSETEEGKVSEEWVGKRQFLALRFCRSRRKGSALKNLAGALHTDRVGCTLSVGGEVKMEIPVRWCCVDRLSWQVIGTWDTRCNGPNYWISDKTSPPSLRNTFCSTSAGTKNLRSVCCGLRELSTAVPILPFRSVARAQGHRASC